MIQIGEIISLKDGIGLAQGLDEAAYGELVISENNLGIVLNLLENFLGIAFFSEDNLTVGSMVFRTNTLPVVNISTNLFSKVLDPLGFIDSELIHDLKNITYIFFNLYIAPSVQVEIKAPGIIGRQSVYESLPTGIRIIDSLIPIGLGQRELIIGDRKTGKTAIALDMILNQLRCSKIFEFNF